MKLAVSTVQYFTSFPRINYYVLNTRIIANENNSSVIAVLHVGIISGYFNHICSHVGNYASQVLRCLGHNGVATQNKKK